MSELLQGLSKWERSMDEDPQKRSFAKLQRDANGKFSDDDLARILTESVEDVAGILIYRLLLGEKF
jgi:linoleate 10R-lipoxygenase